MRFLTWIFLFLSGLVFGQNNSLLYQVKGKDKTVSYLFGTIHMIPDSLYYFPGKLDKIISRSNEVILEIANLNDQSAAMKLMELDSGSCFDIFTPQQKDSVLNWGADLLGTQPAKFEKALEKRKPFTLLQLSLQKMITGKVRMIDMEIESRAQQNKIPVSGLETVEYQLAIFDKIPSEEMAEMIMESVRNPEEGEKNFREMVRYYHDQDLEKLAKLIQESDELGSSAEELLDKRNHNWIPKMEELMKTKSCFFAVGAGHLGGSNGVIELLRQKGYEVTPVRY
ncbi:TraB/GumN family protein [Fluviicola sp.]|uniref:TraB/GumN family protein n=1 Tax=Fluviicola sp. TaxID=1917219 RepID=UPI0031D099AC